MSQPIIQHSFSSGEWAPALNARTDLQKYKSGAALLRNFFVDYRGGASSRFGTKYVLKAKGSGKVRLIRFVASQTVSYVLEIGEKYIRFYTNGAPILESSVNITGVSLANPCQITAANTYVNGDWIFISNIGGTIQLNGNFYQVANRTAANFTLLDLYGNAVNSTAFSAYVSGGTVQRVYTVTTSYLATDIPLLKFAQNVSSLYIFHPSYQPSTLTLVTAASWTFSTITFGATITAPANLTSTNPFPGSFVYTYQVTCVDANGQESLPSQVNGDVSNAAQTYVTLNWSPSVGAVSSNVYRIGPFNGIGASAGQIPGFIGSVTGGAFTDYFNVGYPLIPANFSVAPPVPQNPFVPGAPVTSIVVNSGGATTTTPTMIISGGGGAVAVAQLQLIGDTPQGLGSGYVVGDIINLTDGIQIKVASVGGAGFVGSFTILYNGGTRTVISPQPQLQLNTTGVGAGFSMVTTYTIINVLLTSGGAGYLSVPSVTAAGVTGAAFTATIGPVSGGNPSVPAFYQQRLVSAAQVANPQSLNFSNVGAYNNFNYSIPIQADEAISTSIVGGGQLNTIKSMTPITGGLLVLTAAGAWNVTGTGGPITPTTVNAQAQAYNGASDVPPIVVNRNILYVQSKGSIVRDLEFNFYAQIFTGTDITVLSSHLFYGHSILEWAHAEEPFKLVWAVREDGNLLSLTYLKEQEILGWAHSDTFGLFTSVATVPETVLVGSVQVSVDAVYFIVTRTVNGVSVQYIERMIDRFYPYGVEDSWCVDAALQTAPLFVPGTTLSASASSGAGVTFTAGANVFSASSVGQIIRTGGGIATITAFTSATKVVGTITQAISVIVPNDPNNTPQVAPAGSWSVWSKVSTVSGLQHLAGQSVYGVADGVAVGPLTVSLDQLGTVALPNPASKVTLGLKYTPQLQTLRLDTGEPTIQGKRKKIPAVTVRVQDTLGLSIGRSFGAAVAMKDLVVGNVGTMSNSVVNGLVTDDARTLVDPLWDVPGEYCIQQSNPFPATILGVIPEIELGDTIK